MHNELQHFGIKGQRWGVRRWQNEDGTLTEAGKKHYGEGGERSRHGMQRDLNNLGRENTWAKNKVEKFYVKQQEHGQKKHGLSTIQDNYDFRKEKYEGIVKRNEDMSKKIIDKALEKKYSVLMKDSDRSAIERKYNEFINQYQKLEVSGTRYKVRKPKVFSSNAGKVRSVKRPVKVLDTYQL